MEYQTNAYRIIGALVLLNLTSHLAMSQEAKPQQPGVVATQPPPTLPLPPIEMEQVETVEKGVKMTLSMPKQERAGERLNLTIDLVNQTDKLVAIGFSGYYFNWHIHLVNSFGEVIPRTRYGNQGWDPRAPDMEPQRWSSFRDLRPGETFRTTMNLAVLFDLSIPTEYRLTLQRNLNEISPAADKIHLESKPLSFSLLDPAYSIRTLPKGETEAPL